MNIKEIAERFKIRCSAIGKIMTNPRGKSNMIKYTEAVEKLAKDEKRYDEMKTKDGAGGLKLYESIKKQCDELPGLQKMKDVVILGDTAKTYCLDWLKEQPEFYGRRKEIKSKYIEKGNVVEDHALDFVSDNLGYGLLTKNERNYKNKFMTGTPDNVQPDETIDTKANWDQSTFPLFESGLPNMDYYWQGQGYMHLTKRTKHRVIYCLMDTPEYLIEREARNYAFFNGYGDLDKDLYDKFVDKMTFGKVKIQHRIKAFDIEFEKGAIDQIEIRVKECREFIFNTLTLLGNEQGSKI